MTARLLTVAAIVALTSGALAADAAPVPGGAVVVKVRGTEHTGFVERWSDGTRVVWPSIGQADRRCWNGPEQQLQFCLGYDAGWYPQETKLKQALAARGKS